MEAGDREKLEAREEGQTRRGSESLSRCPGLREEHICTVAETQGRLVCGEGSQKSGAVCGVGLLEQPSKTYFVRDRENICKYNAVPATCVAGVSPPRGSQG